MRAYTYLAMESGANITGNDLISIGFRPGRAIGVALRLIPQASKQLDRESMERELRAVLADPVRNAMHPQFAELAQALREEQEKPDLNATGSLIDHDLRSRRSFLFDSTYLRPEWYNQIQARLLHAAAVGEDRCQSKRSHLALWASLAHWRCLTHSSSTRISAMAVEWSGSMERWFFWRRFQMSILT